MKYKLSNTATINAIETYTGLTFKYPHIYKSKLLIDGNSEHLLPIITNQNDEVIQFGIWGLLPQQYDDEWEDFQDIKSTLTVSQSEIDGSKLLYKEAFKSRRCVILITGYYTYYLQNNEIKKYLVSNELNLPFYLAGIYNVLKDGFITFSIVNVKQNHTLSQYQNLHKLMPLVIPKSEKHNWLHNNFNVDNLDVIKQEYLMPKYHIQQI